MEWGGGGGGGGGVSPARWCEESTGDSEELQFEGDQGMGKDDDHLHEDDDAESCTGGDEEEEEEETMQGNNGSWDQRRSKVVVDNGWRRWFPTESCCCCSSICEHEEINIGSEQCVRSVCVDQKEHSVHQIQDNRLFWETCMAVGY